MISPDGSRLAFIGVDDNGQSQIWVRPLGAVAARPLAGTANAMYPFWSPDSRNLAFFADGKLKTVSIQRGQGGAPKTLCDSPDGHGGSWGSRGIIVFAADGTGGLSRIPAAGGDPVPVTALDPSRQEVSHQQPEFLPDGRHFLYVAISNRTDNNGIFVGDSNAKPDHKDDERISRLLAGSSHVAYASSGHLLFLQDDNLMAQALDAQKLMLSGQPVVVANRVAHGANSHTSDYSVSTNSVLVWRSLSGLTRQLTWFDRGGKQIADLDAHGPYFNPALSPEGERVAVSKLDALLPPTGNIWLNKLLSGPETRLTSGSGAQLFPVWSPDGRWIVFGKAAPPGYGLYRVDVLHPDTEEQLLKSDVFSVPMDWSRDGRFVLFAQVDAKTKWDLWILPLAGDRKPVAAVRTDFNDGDGQFSPDGRWIAYWSDESGRWEVYVRPFPDGGVSTARKWQVSINGGTWPRWRRDGKELFFKAPDGKIMAVPVKLGAEFAAGTPTALFDPHDIEPDNLTYDIRPDGQRFLISRLSDEGAVRPINVSMNWRTMIKR